MGVIPVTYWYVSRSNEIFLDLDSRLAMTRAFRVLKVWLNGSEVKWNLPKPIQVFHYPTGRPGHCHVVVVLPDSCALEDTLRATLALWMGSDKLRTAYVLERQRFGLGSCADILCGNRTYHRKPDYLCMCPAKHKQRRLTDRCPALRIILGVFRSADFFPRTGYKRVPALRIPVGKVPLTIIKRWKNKGVKNAKG